ncbi:MAG: AmmeMemoRadiSam system protein A [Bacteroidales bacterium]|nr:AmmeMemoRadiSam system protein A [Bacteroidales bacterium]
MFQPKSIYSKIALKAILAEMAGNDPLKIHIPDIPAELYETRKGCFVSLHKPDGELRGCIGTIEPCEKNLYFEIIRNAVSSAFSDSRFEPLTDFEMENLEISVDVLTVPEEIESPDDLDPQIFGLIVTDNRNKRAVLLPGIPGIDTIEKQIRIVKRKAGLSQSDDNELYYFRFTSTRFH